MLGISYKEETAAKEQQDPLHEIKVNTDLLPYYDNDHYLFSTFTLSRANK